MREETPTLRQPTATEISLFDRICFALVGLYLAVALFVLLFTRRLRLPFSIRQSLRAWFRKPLRGELSDFEPEMGHCYLAPAPPKMLSDRDGVSRLQVFENGVPLTPHAGHERIRDAGAGVFSHWGDWIYFSSSDNTDPRCNGRRYTFAEAS